MWYTVIVINVGLNKNWRIIKLKTNKNERYIDIFSDAVTSNISGFKFNWDYINKGGKKSPTYIFLKRADFVSGGKETKRKFSKGEQRNTGILLARLAIQVFKPYLDKLSESERNALKTDSRKNPCGLWTDKSQLYAKWGRSDADPYWGNGYPTNIDADYYFYNAGLFDSMCMSQNFLKMFGKKGDYFRVYVTQKQEIEVIPPDKTWKGENVIFYGVPGCGKSYSIEERIIEASGEAKPEIIRIVFHPDYTYSDFVGQILPKLKNDKVVYEFVPGPFTEALELAHQIVKIPVFLIIEEINRGNAAAIFGDIFQLLDREENGESKYSINNKDISQDPVKIPSNLYIYATMNTSDQNVFTLDTAFQRRFEMELVRNVFDDNQIWEIPETDITWKTFAEEVNKLLTKQDAVMSSEDKSLGAWFVKQGITKSRFANKVLKYLWDDAFKFDRAVFFNDKYTTLQGILDEFFKTGFDNILVNKLQSGGDDNDTDED
jgi:hypothetical protein